MKALKRILLGMVVGFAFIFVLVSCSGSKVSQAYADTINNSAKSNPITYETAKNDLGKECNDFTIGKTGYMFAIKGYDNLDNQEAFNKLMFGGDENTKYQVIIIYCDGTNCVNAQYFEGSGAEVSAKLEAAIKF